MTAILTEAEILERAPAVFADRAAGHLSSKYVLIDTAEVLGALRDEGFVVTGASQPRARMRNPQFVQHSLVLRHADTIGSPAVVGEAVPQILLANSHNGRSQMSVRAGLYRFVCSNGMVVGEDSYVTSVRHASEAAAQVVARAKAIAGSVGTMHRLIERWKSIELSASSACDFAKEAARLRFGVSAEGYALDDILRVRRGEDDGRALWSVFNRVQENLSKGGLVGRGASARRIVSRPIVSAIRDAEFNADLWRLAESVAEA